MVRITRRHIVGQALGVAFLRAATAVVPPSYALGPGDQVSVRVLHAAEFGGEPVSISEDGYIRLPLAGRLKADGLTTEQLAQQVRLRLDNLIRDPEVTVEIVEMKSHPVSVLGAVRSPGVYQLQTKKRLLEVLSGAGGLDQDAGFRLRLSRETRMGKIPLPAPQITESGEYQVAEISLEDLVEGKTPEQNLQVLSGDVITVPRAKLVYVIGEVRKSGGFVLHERQSMSVLQALSMAEGLMPTAASKNARILRPSELPERKTEIPVNVRDVLAGKSPDVALLPNDILFIPTSATKSAALRGIETAIQMGTGVVIWRR